MADVYEQNLGAKSSLTTSDYIRVVGSDNVSYKQLLNDVMSTEGLINITGIASGTAPSAFIKSCLENGTLPYNTAFVARISAGYYFWAVGHFYKVSNQVYGSAIVSRPNYMCKVNCYADTWTEATIQDETTQVGTLSSSHTLVSNQCYIVKVGKVVYLTIGLTTTSSVASYGTLVTIPSGYRPYSQLWGTSIQGKRYDITTGGALRTIDAAGSGDNYNISCSYIIA